MHGVANIKPDDYITIQVMNNGFLIEYNAYRNERRRRLVAKDRKELLELLDKEIFPEDEDDAGQ